MLRLLKLPEKTKAFLAEGKLSAGHARALLSVADPDALAERISSQGLSVRDVERIGQKEARAAELRRPAQHLRRKKKMPTRGRLKRACR